MLLKRRTRRPNGSFRPDSWVDYSLHLAGLYQCGVEQGRIAEITGLSRRRVAEVLRTLGLPIRPAYLPSPAKIRQQCAAIRQTWVSLGPPMATIQRSDGLHVVVSRHASQQTIDVARGYTQPGSAHRGYVRDLLRPYWGNCNWPRRMPEKLTGFDRGGLQIIPAKGNRIDRSPAANHPWRRKVKAA